jgi:ADP-heptose:LPS heptosyltransferase
MNLNLKKQIDFWIGNLLLFFLKPIVRFLGVILSRNHDPAPKGDIAFIKLLGGGSLVIALPALLAIKKKYSKNKLILVTTPAIKPFAQTLNIFDEYVILEDKKIFSLIFSSLHSLWRLWRIDTVIDYEVHSRLTTLFSLFTCARNRIGFYRDDVRDRQFFSTHTIFFNLFYGSWYFYESISRLLGCEIPKDEEVRNYFQSQLKAKKDSSDSDVIRIGIGHGCSDLSPERMLGKEEWFKHFSRYLELNKKYQINFLGGPKEKKFGDELIAYLSPFFPQHEFINHCGKMKLGESIELLSTMNEFWGIDSALLHYARLLGIKSISYFGPTMPQSLIKPYFFQVEEIHYQQVACSPCVHATEIPPCHGHNICIKNLFLS